MLDYLAVFEQAANRFPGFESEIQGVYRRTEFRRLDQVVHVRAEGLASGLRARAHRYHPYGAVSVDAEEP